ncbi:hypothetical protein ABBQ32_014018 [Trebouxia sp. C0010 RCD-2024]
MADVLSPNASAPDAQAAAAARKARRKKTRWGADVESTKGDTKVAQGRQCLVSLLMRQPVDNLLFSPPQSAVRIIPQQQHPFRHGWLVHTHPHQMVAPMAQREMTTRLCLGHLCSQ